MARKFVPVISHTCTDAIIQMSGALHTKQLTLSNNELRAADAIIEKAAEIITDLSKSKKEEAAVKETTLV